MKKMELLSILAVFLMNTVCFQGVSASYDQVNEEIYSVDSISSRESELISQFSKNELKELNNEFIRIVRQAERLEKIIKTYQKKKKSYEERGESLSAQFCIIIDRRIELFKNRIKQSISECIQKMKVFFENDEELNVLLNDLVQKANFGFKARLSSLSLHTVNTLLTVAPVAMMFVMPQLYAFLPFNLFLLSKYFMGINFLAGRLRNVLPERVLKLIFKLYNGTFGLPYVVVNKLKTFMNNKCYGQIKPEFDEEGQVVGVKQIPRSLSEPDSVNQRWQKIDRYTGLGIAGYSLLNVGQMVFNFGRAINPWSVAKKCFRECVSIGENQYLGSYGEDGFYSSIGESELHCSRLCPKTIPFNFQKSVWNGIKSGWNFLRWRRRSRLLPHGYVAY